MKFLRITMQDGSKWDVPVEVIAKNRAAYYAHEYGGDVARSLKEDTMPLFGGDDYAIEDWAANNMNWSDVADVAKKVEDGTIDFQEGWINGEKEIVDEARK